MCSHTDVPLNHIELQEIPKIYILSSKFFNMRNEALCFSVSNELYVLYESINTHQALNMKSNIQHEQRMDECINTITFAITNIISIAQLFPWKHDVN